nr:hypothetical protein [Tanacetum cinerariifolium]
VSVAPEVGAVAVASPAGVLELDTHSSLEADPLESSPPPVSIAPMVLHFLCSDDLESDTEIPERHVSLTTSTLEILTTPILPAPSTIDIPIGRLYRTHSGGPCKALIARKSLRPLPSHRLELRDLFIHRLLGLHNVARPIFVGGLPYYLLYLLPPRKRFMGSISQKDSVVEDIDTDVRGVTIKAEATTIKVVVDKDVKAEIDVGIGMEVDVWIDVEDEAESSDRGTIVVGVVMDAGIDIPDGMLMPDAIEHLELVEEAL